LGVGASRAAPLDRIVGLLRLDPEFVRLHQAMRGLRRAAGEAPHIVQTWARLGRRAGTTGVATVAQEASIEEEDAADAYGLLEDVRRLRADVKRARAELRRGQREELMPAEVARAEADRLAQLEREITALQSRARRAAQAADVAIEAGARPGLRPMLAADLRRARTLDRAARELQDRLGNLANQLAERALERMYESTRRVLDKAKLGKIDAVIGQKRRLDIEVQDLASGRWPAELRGRLWEQGLIGDDEEYWPFEGEYWADEYEGWR
ncbi:MAG: hypothetical protein AAGC55_17260, partial [Myxococcota bacterium]